MRNARTRIDVFLFKPRLLKNKRKKVPSTEARKPKKRFFEEKGLPFFIHFFSSLLVVGLVKKDYYFCPFKILLPHVP
jgi:hypothetical protein